MQHAARHVSGQGREGSRRVKFVFRIRRTSPIFFPCFPLALVAVRGLDSAAQQMQQMTGPTVVCAGVQSARSPTHARPR